MAMVPTICLGTRSSWKQTISCFRACAVPQKTIEKAAPSLYHGAARVKSRAAQAPGPQKDIPSGSGGAEVIGRFKGVGVHRPVVEVAASEAALGELAVGMIVV